MCRLSQKSCTRLAVLLNAVKGMTVSMVGVEMSGWSGLWARFSVVYRLLSPSVKAVFFKCQKTFTKFCCQVFHMVVQKRNKQKYFQLVCEGTVFECAMQALDQVCDDEECWCMQC